MNQANEKDLNKKKSIVKTIKGKRGIIYTIACSLSIVLSIVFSSIMIGRGQSPRTLAFSQIGNENQALFILWGITTSLAVYLNLKLLRRRLKYNNKAFEILLAIGCSMAIVTTCVVGSETVRRVIHIGSAMAFGLLCVACVVWLMVIKYWRKNKKATTIYLTAIALSALILIFSTISVGWFTAYTQILITNVSLIIMFFSNFVEKWTVE